MTRVLIALAAAVALLVLAPSASAAKRDCWPSGSRTVVHTEHARVYTVREDGYNVARACLYRTGRRVKLDDLDYSIRSFAPYRLAGPYVAYMDTFVPIEPYDNSDRYVRIVDLRTGRVVRDAVAWRGDDEPVTDPGDYPQPELRALELSKAGRAAWISDWFKEREVWRLDIRGARRLDRRTGSGLRSLNIGTSRVTWLNAGTRNSASFR